MEPCSPEDRWLNTLPMASSELIPWINSLFCFPSIEWLLLYLLNCLYLNLWLFFTFTLPMLSPVRLVGEWVSSCRGLSCQLELYQENLSEGWDSKQAAEQIVKKRMLGHPSDIEVTEDILSSCQLPKYSILFNYLFHLLPQNFSFPLKGGSPCTAGHYVKVLHCRTLFHLQSSTSSATGQEHKEQLASMILSFQNAACTNNAWRLPITH